MNKYDALTVVLDVLDLWGIAVNRDLVTQDFREFVDSHDDTMTLLVSTVTNTMTVANWTDVTSVMYETNIYNYGRAISYIVFLCYYAEFGLIPTEVSLVHYAELLGDVLISNCVRLE